MKPSAKHEVYLRENKSQQDERKPIIFEVFPIMKQLSDVSLGTEQKATIKRSNREGHTPNTHTLRLRPFGSSVGCFEMSIDVRVLLFSRLNE